MKFRFCLCKYYRSYYYPSYIASTQISRSATLPSVWHQMGDSFFKNNECSPCLRNNVKQIFQVALQKPMAIITGFNRRKCLTTVLTARYQCLPVIESRRLNSLFHVKYLIFSRIQADLNVIGKKEKELMRYYILQLFHVKYYFKSLTHRISYHFLFSMFCVLNWRRISNQIT